MAERAGKKRDWNQAVSVPSNIRKLWSVLEETRQTRKKTSESYTDGMGIDKSWHNEFTWMQGDQALIGTTLLREGFVQAIFRDIAN